MYIDAVFIKGETRSKSCHIEINSNADNFAPLDLSSYSVKFRILGSPTADAKVLVEHLITQNTTQSVDGIISNPTNGDFIFTVTAEDTNTVGLGDHPIQLVIVDAESLEDVYTLTEGGEKGEFNHIQVVQV